MNLNLKDKKPNSEKMTDGLLAQEVVKRVARYLSITVDEVFKENITFDMFVKTHQQVRENIAECFNAGHNISTENGFVLSAEQADDRGSFAPINYQLFACKANEATYGFNQSWKGNLIKPLI